MAGIVGGANFGVAKKVQLVSVKVGNRLSGGATVASVAAGIRLVIDDVTAHQHWPAVINMSTGLCASQAGQPCDPSQVQPVIDAINDATAAGIPVVVVAGDGNVNACANPILKNTNAIGVGTTQITNSHDERWVTNATEGSDFGPCVKIWAPSWSITSDTIEKTDPSVHDAIDTDTGTSRAAPAVTGAVALLLDTAQFAHASVAEIINQLLGKATTGVLDPATLGAGSPNLMLYRLAAVAPKGPAVALAAQAERGGGMRRLDRAEPVERTGP